jgi:rhamnosyltransferase subunit B
MAGLSANPRRIVLSTTGTFGDIHPFIAVAKGLRERGAEATIASWPMFRSKVESEGLRFHPLWPDLGPADIAPEVLRQAMDLRFGSIYVIENFVLPYLEQNYDELLPVCRNADLVVTNNSGWAAAAAAGKLGIPWLSAYLQPLGFFSRFDPPVLPSLPLQTRLGASARWAHALTFPLAKRRTRDLIEPVQRLRERAGLPRSHPHPLFHQNSPFGSMAWFSRMWASPRPDWPPRTVITGFPFYDGGAHNGAPDAGLDRFLARGEPPVVFTLGASAALNAGDFYEQSAAIAHGLGVRAVLLTGAENPAPSEHADIYIAGYVPYSYIFPRAAVVVHAGGIGTIALALRAGRPMLIVPFAHDQPDNAHRAARLGVARVIARDSYRPGVAVPVLKALLRSSRIAARSASLAKKMMSEDGVAGACACIEDALRRA